MHPPTTMRESSVTPRTETGLRVLWLTKGLGPGGTERLLVAHARVGDHDRFDYRAAYLRPDKVHLTGELRDLGVPSTCLGAATPADLRWLWRLRRMLVRERIDVLHVQSPSVAPFARLVARTVRPRPRVVYTEHNTWSSYRPGTRWANRLTYRLDDAHVAVSEEVRRSTPARVQRQLDTVIHGIDVAAVRAQVAERDVVRAELGIGPDEVVIGTVANLRAQKAYPDLLAAAVTVTQRCPQARFVSVGQGPLEAEIKAEHARLGLGDRFVFLGYRPDATRVMAAFDVFTLASLFEGLPVTLMESRALGLPVVVTAVGGLVAHVADGDDGLLVPPGEPAALAEALVRVVEDAELRRRLAQRSAGRAEAFDARTAARAVEARYLGRTEPVTSPRVSVVMSAYNEERYIAGAIESILAQTFTDFEFVIVDDGSTDRTVEIIESYDDPRIRLLRQPQNHGVVAAWTRGIAESTGEYIARMDADDLSHPERFERQVAFLDRHPDVAAVGTTYRLIDHDGITLQTAASLLGDAVMRAGLLHVNVIAHPSVMMRRTAFVASGGYREEAFPAEDYDLWCRMARLPGCQVENLPEVLLDYRVNPNGVSSTKKALQRQQADAVSRSNSTEMLRWPLGRAIADARKNRGVERRARRASGVLASAAEQLAVERRYLRAAESALAATVADPTFVLKGVARRAGLRLR